MPSNSVFSGAHYYDGNNFEYGTHYSAIDTSGNVSTMLWVHHPNGNAAQLGIYQNSSGDTWTYAPPCSSNNSIVTTTGISKAENGYVKYGNGIIAQWGYVAVSASTIADKSYTINLNTPFISSNYYVNGTFKYTASTSNWGAGCPGVSAKTTSNFTIIADGINSSHPISGVYWFAYGY